MILLTELSRRRIRSINKLIRVGRNEVVVVVRVDHDTGYIDLSKRRVSPEDISKCEEKFVREKTVSSILRHTAEVLGLKTNEEFEELYDKTAWFYDEKYKQAGAAYDVFARAVNDERELADCRVDEETRQILLNNIRRQLTPQAVKCRADVEVACYGYDGVDVVKAALREGLNASTEEMPVKVESFFALAPPLYVITATCLDPDEGLDALRKAIRNIKLGIDQYRGILKIKMEPTVLTDMDDIALKEAMKKADDDNHDTSGDEDSDEDEESGIKGKLPGEEEASGATTESKRSSQNNQKLDDDDAFEN